MADLLRIYTLGGLQVFKGDEPVTVLETRKVEALLVYLACTRRVHSREVLAELLWEERSQQPSLSNLRVALANLRKYLGEFLEISREGVGLQPGANLWLDVAELESNLSALRTGKGVKTAQTAECIVRAAALYRGEFLEGFFVRDCQGFEDWYLRERERLHRLTVEALHDLVDYEIERRAYKTGVAHAMRLLELDPLMETAHRQMMTLLASSGRRGEALAQYQAYGKLLQEELGIEPAAATKALYEKIRQGELVGTATGERVIMEPQSPIQIPFTDLPEGTVTFLYSDIEGSTQLLHRLREGFAAVLADQRRILRQAFAKWNGHEVDTQADAFFVAFSRATQAVGAAAEAQRKLAEYTWPEGVCVRVRMGIHTGEPWSAEEGYVGMDVHRAARITHVGHGGQVLLSETTTALVRDELPPGVSLADLGRHLLKDIHRPERISQLVIQGLPAEFPTLTSLEALPPEGRRLPRPVGKCPYRGLAAFQELDAPFYFGRETFISSLEHAIRTKQLVAVIVGSSGSGKSSALFAGLLPRLRAAGGFQFAIFRPGSQPFYALAGALLPLLDPGLSETDRLAETRKLAECLAKGEVSLSQVTGRILEKAPEIRHILLVVDQFEELYTLCPDPRLQVAFIDELLATVEAARTQRDAPSFILLTLRADFMGQALAHRPFADALQEASLLMGPMTRPELHMAVEKPAEMQGAAFEPGLVERILDDVGEKPGNLPLLEFTLTQLWEQQTDGWLTHANYEAMGSVEGALSAYADQVYAGLEADEQERARRALVQLVQPGEGTEDTRRIATREELGDESWSLIQRLADRRLVVTGRDTAGHETAEVVHEALIQKWGRFQSWMDADRAFRAWQERLRANLRQWQESGQDEGALLRGAPLAEAEAWLKERSQELSHVEGDYIQAGIDLRERQHLERERRRQRTVLALTAGLVLVAALGVIALFASQRASRSAQTAQTEANTRATAEANAIAAKGEALQLADLRKRDAQVNQSLALAAQSRLALQADNLDLALALAMEANRIPNPPGQAQMALSEAAYAPGTIRVFRGHQAYVNSVAVSPDGRYGLSGDDDGVIFLWDLESGTALRRLEGHKGYYVMSVAFTPDGRQAVSGSWDKTIIHWDLVSGQIIRRLTGHQAGINTVAISPDGRLVASGAGRWVIGGPLSPEDNSLRLWDLRSGEEIRHFTSFTDSVNAVSFTPDGRQRAVGTLSDGFQLLDIETGKALIRRAELRSIVDAVKAGRDGKIVLTANDFDVVLRDLQSGETIRLGKHNGSPIGLDISPDGKRGLSGSGSAIIEYDLQSRKEICRFNIDGRAVAYLPDGQHALAGSADGTVRLLALANGAEIGQLPAGLDYVRGVAYDPSGRSVVTNDTWSLSRWDLGTGEQIWNVSIGGSGIWDIALSPDGRRLLASDFNSPSASLWDAASVAMVRRLEGDGSFEGHPAGSYVDAVAFHPSGKYGLSGSQGVGTTLIYWDLETGKPVWIFDTGTVLGVAVSPNGRTALSTEGWPHVIKWWDLETGKLIRTLEGHTNAVWSAAFVDDRTAISGSDDGTMILWDLESGAALRSFIGHSAGIRRVALSPDKRLVLSASRDGSVILWDMQSGEPLRRYFGHTDELIVVAWGPDGEEALSGGKDRQAIRWRIDADLETFLEWAAHNRYVRPLTCDERLAFHVEPPCAQEAEIAATEPVSPTLPQQGSEIALLPALATPTPLVLPASPVLAAVEAGRAEWGANTGSIALEGGQVWEYAGKAGERLSIQVAAEKPANLTWDVELQNKSGLLDPTLAVYSPDGGLLGQADDLESGTATDAYLASLTLPQTGLYRIEVRSYQDQTGGSYRLILAEPRPLVFKANVPTAAGLAIHPDGKTALVGVGFDVWGAYGDIVNDYRIWVWDLMTGEVQKYLEGHADTPVQVAISPDGLQALSASLDGQAILWDLQSGAEIRRLDNQGEALTGILFHPDGKTALTASTDTTLALWDLASGEVLRRFEGHEDWVSHLALSPDGTIAYSTSSDYTLRVWDVATGELLATYQPFGDSIPQGLAVSPDGKKLLVGRGWDPILVDIYKRNIDAPIALLDASTGETLLNLSGHTWNVFAVAFSPDGRYALSGSGDQTVRLWDVKTGKQLAVFTGHTEEIVTVAFSPDGLTGYSTGFDGSLRVWDLSEYLIGN